MERIIVTLTFPERSSSRDLDVPSDITAEALVREIASSFGLSGPHEIYAHSVGRALFPQEPLGHAGVWDGAMLTLQPLGADAQRGQRSTKPRSPGEPPPPQPEPPPDSPVRSWRPLIIPTSDVPEETPAPKPGGFKWKRIDDD